MAQKTDAELTTQNDVIRNEVAQSANTKGRIADMNKNLIDSKANNLLVTNRQAASYNLVIADAGALVEMNVAGANNLVVPPNSSVAFAVGTQIMIAQYGAGQTSIVAGAGVTIRSDSGKLKVADRYSAVTLVKIATDEWYLFGNLTA